MIPTSFMKMDILRWANTHRCIHGHTFLEHFPCYLKEVDYKKKVGFFDIETSSLVADFGIVITWYILGRDGEYHGRTITKEEVTELDIPDQFLMNELSQELNNWDLLYTYNGTRFDLPYVRTRCTIAGIDFPSYGALKHKDIYFIIKNKFRLHRKSQEIAAEMLLGETEKTHWSAKYWIKAVQGDPKALDYIDKHCRIDCAELKAITEKVIDFSMPVERSL
jgi:uncharacterized protein YprB with RNaseH-like and TPR domain